jgi:hypothetical protein
MVLSSTCSPAHGLRARNDGRSTVLLVFRSISGSRRPGGIVLPVAPAQFTNGYGPHAGPGAGWSDADRPGRAPSQRSPESGTGGVSVDIEGSYAEPGLPSPGFFASEDGGNG